MLPGDLPPLPIVVHLPCMAATFPEVAAPSSADPIACRGGPREAPSVIHHSHGVVDVNGDSVIWCQMRGQSPSRTEHPSKQATGVAAEQGNAKTQATTWPARFVVALPRKESVRSNARYGFQDGHCQNRTTDVSLLRAGSTKHHHSGR
jgi:hypothetical protein